MQILTLNYLEDLPIKLLFLDYNLIKNIIVVPTILAVI